MKSDAKRLRYYVLYGVLEYVWGANNLSFFFIILLSLSLLLLLGVVVVLVVLGLHNSSYSKQILWAAVTQHKLASLTSVSDVMNDSIKRRITPKQSEDNGQSVFAHQAKDLSWFMLKLCSENGRQDCGSWAMDGMCGHVSSVALPCCESAFSLQRPAGRKIHSFQSHQADTDR